MTRIIGLQSFLISNLEKINKELKFPLVKGKSRKGHSEYTFEGINERLSLFVSKNEADIWYSLGEERKDLLFDLSVDTKFTSGKGYYCGECKSPIFNSESELYISHFLEDLQKLQTKYFKPNHYLFFKGSKSGGFFYTQIKKLADLKKLYSVNRLENQRDQMDLIAIEKITF
ncbi:hypothetical protein LFX15_18220 [Leptospira levettii]|uniref:hypothetical protein n=1 Tax=Leptospira levettii TaxID=2023178 RepID=UPI001EEA2080|nr:hypothetical protein [Leptospira levettii]MCG6150239.1 hypothetical protein [Leptospira levettii]